MHIMGLSWICLDRSGWNQVRGRSNDWLWEDRMLNSIGPSGYRMNQRLDTFCHQGYRSAIENKIMSLITWRVRLERKDNYVFWENHRNHWIILMLTSDREAWEMCSSLDVVKRKDTVPKVQLVADSTTRDPPDDLTKGRLVCERRREYLVKASWPAS